MVTTAILGLFGLLILIQLVPTKKKEKKVEKTLAEYFCSDWSDQIKIRRR